MLETHSALRWIQSAIVGGGAQLPNTSMWPFKLMPNNIIGKKTYNASICYRLTGINFKRQQQFSTQNLSCELFVLLVEGSLCVMCPTDLHGLYVIPYVYASLWKASTSQKELSLSYCTSLQWVQLEYFDIDCRVISLQSRGVCQATIPFVYMPLLVKQGEINLPHSF